MVWENPYKIRIDSFPGRLFSFSDFEEDRGAVRALLHNGPVYCEIGSGSGRHALEFARRNPTARVFGFELRYKRAFRTIEKAERLAVPNVFVLRAKGELLEDIFPARSLDGAFVHFPDPWAKGRWHKHRILGPELLERLSRLLKPGGFLQVKTDHQEYFSSFMSLVEADRRFAVQEQSSDLYGNGCSADNIASEFESLFRDKQQSICYARIVLI